ncbi:VOC family protein [Chloroflexota bacterium]
MLTNTPITLTLLVRNVGDAKIFYDRLGFTLLRDTPLDVMYDCGNNLRLWLYQEEAAKAFHSTAVFRVEDIEKEVKELKEKGVVFEELDTQDFKTIDSISTSDKQKGAWFKDTDGHYFAIVQFGN